MIKTELVEQPILWEWTIKGAEVIETIYPEEIPLPSYDYGRSQEPLDYATQIRNKPTTSGWRMKVGHFSIVTTWVITVTWVGFQPSKVNIIANVNWSTWILRSNWWYDTSTYCSYDYMTNSTHPQKSYYSTNQIVLRDDWSTGTFLSTYASFVSFNADGFTLNVPVRNQTVQCIYIVYE